MEKIPDEKKELKTTGELISFAFEVGYTIAIPLIIFVLGGRFADKYFGTAPWLMLTGLILSMFATTVIIYKKTKTLI